MARRFVGDMSIQDFERNELVLLATQRALEVIGDASNKLTPAFRAEHPDFEWSKMIAMRNFLIHNYGNVDAVIVWDVVQNKLPVLLERLTSPTSPKPNNLRRAKSDQLARTCQR